MQIDSETVDFLKKHHLCVIATITADGTPHAVVAHYAIMETSTTLLFSMDDRSITVRSISLNENVAIVVGWSEDIPTTVQMHGKVKIVTDPSELIFTKTTYYACYPYSQQYESDPHTVFLAFTPSWYRLLDPLTDTSLKDFFKRGLPEKAVGSDPQIEIIN